MADSLQIIDYRGAGFMPVMAFEDWRLAALNYSPECDVALPEYPIERHLETDEVFILTEGRAWLLICGSGERWEGCDVVEMAPGVIYNVPLGVWHGTIMAPDSRIILVEKRDTGSARDTLRVKLGAEERERACAQIRSAMCT